MTPLRAGNLTAILDGTDIRYITVSGREVVRRIYANVRDTSWGTINPAIQNLRIEQRADAFRITCLAVFPDIAWTTTIACDGATLTYTIDGHARRAFLTNRTGICLLHPIRELAGRKSVIEHEAGDEEVSRFPELIAPGRVFADIRAMRYESVSIRFEGELFETEDQRNWADTSFKTFCRPLCKPFPYTIDAGQHVHQSVTMTFESARADEQSQPIRLTGRVIGRVPVLRLPDEYHVVYQDRRPVPEMSLLRDARARHPGHKVGIGTIGNFAEINRNREIAAAADVIAYAVNPQVHAMDDLSLVENLPAQGDTVRTVRSFAPRAHLHVGPITLSRQPDPFAAGNDGSAKPVELDSRSAPPLGTAWAVASLKYLAEAGADSVAYADVVLPDAIRNLAGADVLEVTDPQPLRFTALAAGDQLFVINLLNQPAAVPVNGFGAIDLPPYGIKQLRIP